jgi:hypothetical protein
MIATSVGARRRRSTKPSRTPFRRPIRFQSSSRRRAGTPVVPDPSHSQGALPRIFLERHADYPILTYRARSRARSHRRDPVADRRHRRRRLPQKEQPPARPDARPRFTGPSPRDKVRPESQSEHTPVSSFASQKRARAPRPLRATSARGESHLGIGRLQQQQRRQRRRRAGRLRCAAARAASWFARNSGSSRYSRR